ncbi:transposase [Oscillatoria sp. FACHB-1406]|uniref:transposase n=1 Tax=Oscillatoria sp. FACHB-1406 TaxID=2692846 RepID=UPI001683F802|nr:transposase [Oscillatoria sp. FACHB-1406]MBD2576241.1 transposase [Oscillatoria sp. FACHB-1406]
MKYDPQIHHRRSIRLKNYDYRQNGTYFITLCTYEKQCWFGKIVGGEVHLNALGKIARSCWQEIPHHFDGVNLDVFVIMPNHLHGLLTILHETAWSSEATQEFGKMVSGSVSSILRCYKAAVTRKINLLCNSKAYPIWQKNYYEHIVRDEESLSSIRQYIIDNPLVWENDPEYLSVGCSLELDLQF